MRYPMTAKRMMRIGKLIEARLPHFHFLWNEIDYTSHGSIRFTGPDRVRLYVRFRCHHRPRCGRQNGVYYAEFWARWDQKPWTARSLKELVALIQLHLTKSA